MENIQIGNKEIGPDFPQFIIAEIMEQSICHNPLIFWRRYI